MKFGLLLLGEHGPDRLLSLAALAEEHAFQDLWYADEKFYRDPYVGLAYVAQHTRSIRLGSCVTDPFTRHPALIAMAAATLDEVSAGRAVLGMGAGFSGLEAMGVRRARTVRTLRQAIVTIRKLWAGETVSLEEEAFVLRQASLNFPARADIPILIASASKQILRLAGEVADEVMLGDLGSGEVLGRALAEVESGAARAGRTLQSIERIARLNLVLHDDPDAARDAVRPWILAYLWHAYPDWSNLFDYSPDWEEQLQPLKDFIAARGGGPRNVGDREQVMRFGQLIPDGLLRRYALAGRPEDVREQISEIAGSGITQIALFPTPLPGQTTEGVLADFFRLVLARL
jgi:5,10-methylenetetrahydromethanopterin reductase